VKVNFLKTKGILELSSLNPMPSSLPLAGRTTVWLAQGQGNWPHLLPSLSVKCIADVHQPWRPRSLLSLDPTCG